MTAIVRGASASDREEGGSVTLALVSSPVVQGEGRVGKRYGGRRSAWGRVRAPLCVLAVLGIAGCGKVRGPSDADVGADAADGGTPSDSDAGGLGDSGSAGTASTAGGSGAGGSAGALGDAGAAPKPTCPIVYQLDVTGGAYRVQAAFDARLIGMATEGGVPLSGAHAFQVTYYTSETGEAFTTQRAQTLQVDKGCFTMSPFSAEPIGVFWLGIQVDATDLSPRYQYSNTTER